MLKGSVGNFGARKAFAVSQQLENMGRDGDFDKARQACVTLESELEILNDELERLTTSSSKRKKQMRKGSRRNGGVRDR